MVRRDSVRALLASPVGSYVAMDAFAVWSPSPQWLGIVYARGPNLKEEAALVELFPLAGSPHLAARYDLFVDVSLVTRFAEYEYALLERFFRASLHALEARVRRLAVVRPSQGFAEVVIEGIFQTRVASRFDAVITTEREKAFTFLGMTPAAATSCEQFLGSHTRPVELRRLGEVLVRDLRSASLETAALTLGTSPRSLQRMLAANGTNFRAELARARIETAETRLLAMKASVESIAREVGFSSLAAFTTAFTRTHGETPSAFRQRWLGSPGRTPLA